MSTGKHIVFSILMRSTKAALVLLVFLFGTAVARADEVGENILFIRCTNVGVELSSDEGPLKDNPISSTGETIDINSLIKLEKHMVAGSEVEQRVGSKVLEKSCGSFQVKITGGYYNANPQGQGGGANNFPIVSVSHGQTKIIDNYRLADCVEADNYNYPNCPQKWAQDIDISFIGKHSDEVYVKITSQNVKRIKISPALQK